LRKKIIAAFLALVLTIPLMSTAILAGPVGTIAGYVLNTDIRVYLNEMPIEGFNINGETFVRAEDLPPHGFVVAWNGAARSISISQGPMAGEPRRFPPNTQPIGSIAFPYFYTDITAFIDGQPVTSFNIGGYTAVRISDIARAFGNSHWDGENRVVSVVTAENKPFETVFHRGTRFTNVFTINQAIELNAHILTPPEPIGEREIRWDLGATIHAYSTAIVTYMLPGRRGGAFHEIAEDGRLQNQRTFVHSIAFHPGSYLLLTNYTLADDGRPASQRQVTIPIYLVVTRPAFAITLEPADRPDLSLIHPNAPNRASSNIIIPQNRPMTDAELANWIAEYNSSGGASIFELEVVRLINELRAEMGLAPYEICPDLMMAARYKSQEMVNLGYFAHNSPVHGHFTGIPRLFGANAAGENLGSGQGSPQAIVSSWLNSTTGHRSNITSNAPLIGIGEHNNRWTLMTGWR
jgi:uncharacterized protein YkwD